MLNKIVFKRGAKLALAFFLLLGSLSFADVVTIDFQDPDYSVGSLIIGQDGWVKNTYPVSVGDPSYCWILDGAGGAIADQIGSLFMESPSGRIDISKDAVLSVTADGTAAYDVRVRYLQKASMTSGFEGLFVSNNALNGRVASWVRIEGNDLTALNGRVAWETTGTYTPNDIIEISIDLDLDADVYTVSARNETLGETNFSLLTPTPFAFYDATGPGGLDVGISANSDGFSIYDNLTIEQLGGASQPPVAVAGVDQTVYDVDENGEAAVTLNASYSYDPDGSIVSYAWTEQGNPLSPDMIAHLNLSVGDHKIDLTVTDNDGLTHTDSLAVVVISGPPSAYSLFAGMTPQDSAADSDYELGVKFVSSQDGQITHIRFYKMPDETGTHIGRIWDVDGKELTNVTFTGESDSGWQEMALATPLVISAGTIYMVSVNHNAHYPFTEYELSTSIANGPLSTVADGNNGAHNPAIGLFPFKAWHESNYYSDVVFLAATSENQPPIADAGNDQTVYDGDGDGVESVTLDGSGSYDPDGSIVSYTWKEGGSTLSTEMVAVSDLAVGTHQIVLEVKDDGDLVSSDIAIITIEGIQYEYSLFTGMTPQSSATDSDYELGVKFQSDIGGEITKIRFYKMPGESGEHHGKIWDAFGNKLAEVRFTGETESGWQEEPLYTPVTIQANISYIVSVNHNDHYPFTEYELSTSVVSGHLRTVTDGANGVHNPTIGWFPIYTWRESNYYSDVVFIPENINPPENQRPVAVITNPPGDVIIPDNDGDSFETVTLDASGSYDPDGTIQQYIWSIGESGPFAEGRTVTYDFYVNVYTYVTLTVVDDDGAWSNSGVSIDVVDPNANQYPTAIINIPRDVYITDEDGDGYVDFSADGSASYDPDGSIVSYEWYFTPIWPEKIVISTEPTLATTLPIGENDLAFSVYDDDGAMDSEHFRVLVKPQSAIGLVAVWECDQSWQLFDSTGNGNLGMCDSPEFVLDGVFNSGTFLYDGIDDWCNIPDSSYLDLTDGMTIEAWVYPTNIRRHGQTVLMKEHVSSLAYALYASNHYGRPSVNIGSQKAQATSPLKEGAWLHLAGTYDGTTLRLYIDGELVASETVSTGINVTDKPLLLGGNSIDGDFFSGMIDDVRVYNRAISQDQIRHDMVTPVEWFE